MKRRLTQLACLIAIALLAACSSSGKKGVLEVTDYKGGGTAGPDEAVFVTDQGTYVGPKFGSETSGCIDLGDQCVEAIATENERYCAEPGAKMDVVIADGKVVAVVCSPAPTTTTERSINGIAPGDLKVDEQDSGQVLTFQPATDGVPLEKNLEVKAANTTILGNGTDKTIFKGNVKLDKSSARLSGVTIMGNLEIEGDKTAVLHVKVYGHLHVKESANNVVISSVDVFGDFKVDANNTTIVHTRVAKNWDIKGNNNLCKFDFAFNDVNENHSVDPTEIGNPLNCN